MDWQLEVAQLKAAVVVWGAVPGVVPARRARGCPVGVTAGAAQLVQGCRCWAASTAQVALLPMELLALLEAAGKQGVASQAQMRALMEAEHQAGGSGQAATVTCSLQERGICWGMQALGEAALARGVTGPQLGRADQ